MAANGGGGGGGGARGNGGGAIPAAARKIVQSLKEIVNCPEPEIYAMLHECNMDPSETVNRLLSQDTFQEVKSKREKKKESKDTPESKSRGSSNLPNRGARFSTDRIGRAVSNNSASNDFISGRSKPLIRREDGPTTVLSSSVPGYGSSGSIANKHSTSLSALTSSDGPLHTTAIAVENTNMPSNSSVGYQHAWSITPGHLSMADIVKMGRPQAKPIRPIMNAEFPNVSQDLNVLDTVNPSTVLSAPPVIPSESPQDRHPLPDHNSSISNIIHEHTTPEHVSVDSWVVADHLPIEKNPKMSLSLNAPVFTDPSELSSLHDSGLDVPFDSTVNEDEIYTTSINLTGDSGVLDATKTITLHDRQIPASVSINDTSFENRGFYEHPDHAYQHCEDDEKGEAPSLASSLQQLSLQKEDHVELLRDNPGVIFPDHLQVNVDCSHLSFGSFGSGISASFSGSLLSKTQKTNVEVCSATAEVANEQLENSIHGGNHEHLDEEQLRTTSEENLEHITSTSTENYDNFSSPEATVVGPTASVPPHELQYGLPSMPNYAFPDTAQTSSTSHSYSEVVSPAQDITALSNVMQAYSIALSSSMSDPTVQAGREFDLPYSPLLAQQLLVKYSGISSLGGPTTSIPENVKPDLFSMLQTTTQSSASTSLPTGPTVPQHLPVPQYSQPTLSFGPLTNMIGYPYMPPSYPPYLPSAAFQQAYANSNAFHQSPAAVHSAGIKYTLPPYKNSVSVSNLPESGIMPSSYGAFGSSANIPGNFMLNPQSISPSTTLGYNDTLASHQFKDGSHYSSIHQGENSALWLQQAAGSRTMPSLPTSAFYSLQGQSQHSAAFRQLQQQQQQPSQYAVPSFSNFYSHAGASQELPQNSNPGNLSRSQGTGIPSQSSHQLWQNNY